MTGVQTCALPIYYITEGVIGRYTGLNDWIVKITDGKAQGLTFQFILGVITSPFMWLIGVPSQDIMLVGSLLGQKTILNEFVAYFQLQQWKEWNQHEWNGMDWNEIGRAHV